MAPETQRHHAHHHHPHASLWNLPVVRRAHQVADLGRQAFGPSQTAVKLRVDTGGIQMTVTVRGAARGKVSRKTFEVFRMLAQETLDLDVLCAYVQHSNVHFKFHGTYERAERAQQSSEKRRLRRNTVEWCAYFCTAWALIEFVATAWYARSRGDWSGLRATCAFWLWLTCMWGVYHLRVRWVKGGLGPVFR